MQFFLTKKMFEYITTAIGYIAAAFLAAALLINGTLRFRWISAIGNVVFIIYGILLNASPVIATNLILLFINIYKLYKIYNLKEYFEIMEFRKGHEIADRFISFHKEDIKKYFPEFEFMEDSNRICFMVLRDMNIANIFVGKRIGDSRIEVEINFTIQKYKDFQVGKFIFEKKKDFLITKGITTIVYPKIHNPSHEFFLKKMGFIKSLGNSREVLIKVL